MRRRYHLPTDITLPEGLSAQDGQGLSATVLAAVRRAVRDTAPGQTPPPPTRHRPRPRERAAGDDRGLHAVPSYDSAGEKVGIPVASPSPRDPANPHHTLTAREMYGLWQKYWVVRRNRAESRFEEVRLNVWRKDASAYARGTDRFELGHRDALGPEYRAAADERDVCQYMLSAKDQVHVWIEAQETLGKPVTLEQVDAQAVEEAKALGFRRAWIDPVVLSVLAAATYPGGPVRSPATGGGPAAQGPRAAGPVRLAGPAEPAGPARSVGPAEPVGPARPVGPAQPVGAAEPVGRAEPAGRAEPVAPEAPPGAATETPRPAPPSGILASTRALAVRFGLGRAMAGVDEAVPAPRVAASSPVRAETGPSPSPAPPRPSAPAPEPAPSPSPAPPRPPAPAPEPAPTAPAVRRFDLTEPTLTTDEVFARIGDELAHLPAAAPSGTGPAAAVADARAAGLTGPWGAPGTADLAVQRHAEAPAVRGAYGVSGAQVQSAHAGPTSFLRDVPGYSRRDALTVLLPAGVHAAFDQHWKDWAIARRRAGDTQVSTAQLYAAMLTAVDRIPLLDQTTRNTIAWVIHRELFYDLGLTPGDLLTLPYPNVPPSP